MKTEYQYGEGKIELVNDSITNYQADGMVIPANPGLEYAGFLGGVQGSVARDGGMEIFEEAEIIADEYVKQHGYSNIRGKKLKVPLYSAHLTRGGRLPVRYAIHSVALDYTENGRLYCDGEVISKSTKNVLDLGRQNKLKSIGFPALGTGLYGISLDECIEAMSSEFLKHLKKDTTLERLGIVLFGAESYLRARSYLTDKLCY